MLQQLFKPVCDTVQSGKSLLMSREAYYTMYVNSNDSHQIALMHM